MLIVGETQADADRRVAAAARRSPGLDEAALRARCIAGDPDQVAEQAQPLLDAGLDGLDVLHERALDARGSRPRRRGDREAPAGP